MQVRTRRALAWALWCVTAGCCAVGLVYPFLIGVGTTGLLVSGASEVLVFPLPSASLGLVLVLRLPGNPLGWLYSGAGLAWSLVVPWGSLLDLVGDGRALSATVLLVAVVENVAWAPALALGIVLPALLLPDGALRSRRWRAAVVATVAGTVLLVVAVVLTPGTLGERPIDNPFGLTGAAGTAASAIGWSGWALLFGSLSAAAGCVLLRFRASRGAERQQLRWIAAGAAAAVVSFVLSFTLPVVFETIFIPLAVLCPVVAVAVAVLRYRLWELDRLVSRTVTYALVTGLLVLPYLRSSRRSPASPGTRATSASRRPPLPRRRCSSRCAAGSRSSWTGASTGAATTRPAWWRPSPRVSASRSTSTRSVRNCWPSSIRPCSRTGPLDG